MRIDEIARIDTSAIKKHIEKGETFYYFYLSEKNLKTESVLRNAPILKPLIDLSFFNYVKKRIDGKKERLFDFSDVSKGSALAGYISRFRHCSFLLLRLVF